MTLDQLPKKKPARVTGFVDQQPDIVLRLREIGFAENDNVEVRHFGLFGKNPMTIDLNGALIALRRDEAALVEVEIS
jgi:ferrous iron transport protein A